MRRKDLFLIVILIATLSLMVIPISTSLMDGLLALNISLSVILLMVAIYLKSPSDFSTFPSVILLGTAFRLALSIGTTRLILSEADAGSIIETFGEFVVAGSVVIGLVIFLIITAVQFLVITKGAERVAEVAARFTLDALPGKQMTIDAQAKAGDITPEEASYMRHKLDKDSQFFGAMDGAMKFVKGDAIAGIIIICINLVGGVIVGITFHGLSFGAAVGTFSLLTIGDGLVAQLPALLMSLSAGIIVTRVNDPGSEDLGSDISRELIADPRVPTIAAALILLVGLIPGFPFFIFAGFAAALLCLGIVLRRRARSHALAEMAHEAEESEEVGENLEDGSPPLPLSSRFYLTLGAELADGLDLAGMELRLRNRFAQLHSIRGVRFPVPSITEVTKGKADEWCVLLDEVPILRGTARTGDLLVVKESVETLQKIVETDDLEKLKTPFVSGTWVPGDHGKALEENALVAMTVEETLCLIAFRAYENELGAIFSNGLMNELLEMLRAADPDTMAMVEEEMSQPALFKLFNYLVSDGVPMRPPELVVSSLHYWIYSLEQPTSMLLAECLRGTMKRQMCFQMAGKVGVLGLILVAPDVEIQARQSKDEFRNTPNAGAPETLAFEQRLTEDIVRQFRDFQADSKAGSYQPVVVVSADLRRRMRNFLATNDIHLPVLAPHEVAKEVPSFPIGVVETKLRKKPARSREINA